MVEIELLSGEESRKARETVAAAVNDANGRGECTSSLTLDAPQLEAGTGVVGVEASMDTQRLLGTSFDTRFAVIFLFVIEARCFLSSILTVVADCSRGNCCHDWDDRVDRGWVPLGTFEKLQDAYEGYEWYLRSCNLVNDMKLVPLSLIVFFCEFHEIRPYMFVLFLIKHG